MTDQVEVIDEGAFDYGAYTITLQVRRSFGPEPRLHLLKDVQGSGFLFITLTTAGAYMEVGARNEGEGVVQLARYLWVLKQTMGRPQWNAAVGIMKALEESGETFTVRDPKPAGETPAAPEGGSDG